MKTLTLAQWESYIGSLLKKPAESWGWAKYTACVPKFSSYLSFIKYMSILLSKQVSPPLYFKYFKDRNCECFIFVSLVSNAVIQFMCSEIVPIRIVIVIIIINVFEDMDE